MASAHRMAPRLKLDELIAEATDFSRDAWRDCWLVMLLLVAVQTYLFARGHIATADWRRSPIDWLIPLLLVLYVPLYGGLYRSALGGRPLQGLGLGGLQWKGLEWRLITVGVVIAFLIGLATVPFMILNLIAALIMGLHASMSIGPLGGWARWTPAAVVIWLVFFWLMAPRIARLALGWAYSSAAEKTEPFAGWAPGKPSGWSLAFALVLTGAPLLLGWLAIYALTLVEPDTLAGEYWPAPEAVGAGVLLAVLKIVVVAPLSVGVLSGAWWLLEGDARAAAPAAAVPPRHDHRMFLDGLGPVAVAAMTAATASLAAREAAELGLHHTDIDRNAPPPEPEAVDHAEVEATAIAADQPQPHVQAPDEALVGQAPTAHAAKPVHEPESMFVHEAELQPLTLEPSDVPAAEKPEHAAEPVGVADPAPDYMTIKVYQPPPARDFAALSDWPHSVLPAASSEAKATAPTALASRSEPDHPSKGVSE